MAELSEDGYDNETYSYYEDDNDTMMFNETVGCDSSPLHGAEIFLPVAYYLIFFTGFLGNLLVILVVGSRSRKGGRLVDTFIINLALADLVFVLTLPLWAVSARQSGLWIFGNLLCKLSSYIIAVNRFSNIFFLTCMSIDRYLAVVKLMDSRYLRSSQCIRATCAGIWVVSLVLGVPSWIYRGTEKIHEGSNEEACVEINSSTFFRVLSLTMALPTFIFPVLIIMLCYGTIVKHLNQHCVAAVNPRAEARRRHSLKMVLCIIVAFVVSWLPFNIFKAIIIGEQLSNPDIPSTCDTMAPWQRNGLLVSCCLAFLNSCVNPAIYFFLDHHFRRRAENLCKSCIGKPKQLQSHNSSASASESFGTTTAAGRTQMIQMVE